MREKKTATVSKWEIPPSLIEVIRKRLAGNKSVRRALPANGRLHIDRQLPFLCVYRQPHEFEDIETETLV